MGGNYASHFFFLKQSASQIQVDDSRQAELYFSISLCLHLNFQFILFDPKLQFGLIWVSQLSISLSIPTISYVFFFHQWTWSKQFKMKRFLAIDHIWIYLKFIFFEFIISFFETGKAYTTCSASSSHFHNFLTCLSFSL